MNLVMSMSRVVFVLGVALLIVPAVLGYAVFIKYMLSLDFWSVLGKLVFGMFLFHGPMHYYIILNMQSGFYLDDLNINMIFLASWFLLIFVAAALYICIELPIRKLEKFLIFGVDEDEPKQESYL